MKTGNGKVANLPAEIRDELNWRINDGNSGPELVAWLNAKPEVVAILDQLFDGKPISEQNLSQWRTRGYRQWHAEHVILDELGNLSQNAERIEETGVDCGKLLLALKANYAEMIQRWNITPIEQMDYKLEVFGRLTTAVLAMRREEIQKERLEIQRERLELLREKQESQSESSASSRASRSPNRRSTNRAAHPNDQAPDAPDPIDLPRRPDAPPPAETPEAPHPIATTPAQPAAPTAPPKPKIPPYRDPRNRYSLR